MTPPAVRRSILFVCTGNTCRSPLAEGICRAMLAARLGVPVAELESRGYTVRSAGVAAYAGDAASPGAVEAAAGFGADLAGHRSRPVDPDLLADATHVVAMTAGHAAMLDYRFPGDGPPASLLCDDGDLPDPFGGPPEIYRLCADAIAFHLDRRIREWLG